MTQLDFEHDPDTDFEAVDNLSLDDARREVEALREGIEYHDHLYYVANKAEISDAVYDKLFELPYEIDGIVLKADDLELWRKLGARDRSPRWALAWKFQPRQEITRLRQIVVQVGMTGMLTPVALVEPVDVGGVTVSRATLHNEGEVHRKDVRPGDTVRIARAGDVIPEVVERIKRPGRKRAGKFTMPTQCPACGAEVVHEGAYSICPAGISCAPQLVGHLKHFAAQEAMDIDGLGDKTARELVEKELVCDLADLYELSNDDLRRLESFAEKKARKLHDAIQDSKQPRFERFLFALGIPLVVRERRACDAKPKGKRINWSLSM